MYVLNKGPLFREALCTITEIQWSMKNPPKLIRREHAALSRTPKKRNKHRNTHNALQNPLQDTMRPYSRIVCVTRLPVVIQLGMVVLQDETASASVC